MPPLNDLPECSTQRLIAPAGISLGILGGAGAIASARFHLALMERWASKYDARTDADFPSVLHASTDLGLDATGLVGSSLTSDKLYPALASLGGCANIAVVCNSVVPMLPPDNRLITPVFACTEALRDVSTAWLLASDSTIAASLYQKAHPHVRWIIPRFSMTPWIRLAIRDPRGLDLAALGIPTGETVVLGCTELAASDPSWRTISSLHELIELSCTTTRKLAPNSCSLKS